MTCLHSLQPKKSVFSKRHPFNFDIVWPLYYTRITLVEEYISLSAYLYQTFQGLILISSAQKWNKRTWTSNLYLVNVLCN